MAQYPCDRHGGRYQGAQSTLYVSVYDHDWALKRSYRLCKTCLEQSLEKAQEHMALLESVDAEDLITCPSCGRENGEAYITATYYVSGSPIKLAGAACAEHAELVPGCLEMTPGSGQDRLGYSNGV